MEGHHCLISSKVGNRVKAVIGSSTTVYVGTIYEQTTSGGSMTITKYYQAGGQRIALRVNGVVRWLATDHPSASVRLSLRRAQSSRSRRRLRTSSGRRRRGNATRRISGSQDVTLTYDAENPLTAMSGVVTASYVW